MIRRRVTESDLERQLLRDLAKRRAWQRAEQKARAQRRLQCPLEQDPDVLRYREELAKRAARRQEGSA